MQDLKKGPKMHGYRILTSSTLLELAMMLPLRILPSEHPALAGCFLSGATRLAGLSRPPGSQLLDWDQLLLLHLMRIRSSCNCSFKDDPGSGNVPRRSASRTLLHCNLQEACQLGEAESAILQLVKLLSCSSNYPSNIRENKQKEQMPLQVALEMANVACTARWPAASSLTLLFMVVFCPFSAIL
jgi:hypothetical protein